jgi:predicted nucleic acid-binding protein
MEILVDTGVLLRLVIRTDPAHQETRKAVRSLKVQGDRLVALTQNAAEFWNVCTRPISARGYGLSIQEAQKKLRTLERLVEFRADSLAGFREWKRLVVAHQVSGVEVHDTRLVAAMNVQGITHIVTYNKGDFKRFQNIAALLPSEVLSS